MLRSQALDSGDLLEALEQSGSSSEEAEELVGRVMSLTSTNDFFVPLALQHLKKVGGEEVWCPVALGSQTTVVYVYQWHWVVKQLWCVYTSGTG